MDPKPQSKSDTKLIYNWQALKLVLPYLKLSDLLSTITISKQWQYHLNQYIKTYLLPQPYCETATDAFQAAKLVFNRKIMIRQPNSAKQIEFPDICNKIQVGNHVTKFQTLQGNTYIVKNDKLLTLKKKDWSDPTLVYKLEPRFSTARLIGNYLYFIGGSQVVRYTANNENIFNQQQKFQLEHNIDHVILSNSAALFILTNTPKGTQYVFLTHKQPNPTKIIIPISIDNPVNDIILDYGTHGFIISNQGILYEADFQQQQIKVNQFKALKGKNIGKLKCGNRHYFAYERKKKLIKTWTNAEVLKWAEQQGFDMYLNIFQAQKVTGQKLLNMNKTYMEDVLGITNVLTQQKINLLIQQNNKSTDNFEDYVIYYWGKNDKGQLCTNPSANVNNPAKLKLPQNTELYTMFGDHTVLLNTKTQEVTVNTLDEQGKLKWQRLTNNKVWTLAGHKNFVINCQSVGKKWISQSMSQQPIHLKKQKLRTAKNIIDQVQWDGNLNKQQFTVGYLNRHEGTLECSFEQFLKSDVKENSILYFKKNGKLVWDKKTRLDIL